MATVDREDDNVVPNKFGFQPKNPNSFGNAGLGSEGKRRVSEAKAPGWSEDFAARLQAMIDGLGGLKEAAKIAQTTDDTLVNWRRGRTRMILHSAALLCRANGKSINWLYFGESGEDEAFGVEEVRSAISQSADFILSASVWFEDPDPQALAEAISKRAVFLLETRAEVGEKETERLTMSKDA
jgi:hypothetical protein